MKEKKQSRILIVDDDRLARDAIVETLLPRGLNVDVAASADSAMEKAREAAPDLVFVSLFFPGSNGLKVSKRLHALEGLEKVPVVMLTSYKGELDSKYTSTIGIVDVLVKPLKPDEILSKTIAVLGEEALLEPDEEAHAPSKADLYAEKEMAVGCDESLSVSPVEEDGSHLRDFSHEEVVEAAGIESGNEYDETEEFLKEEFSHETATLAEGPPENIWTAKHFSREAGPVSGIFPSLEEEMVLGKEPRRFFAGKKLVVVSVICAALVVGIGSYGLKKILGKQEKASQTRQVMAARTEEREAARGGSIVPGESGGKDTDSGTSAKAEEGQVAGTPAANRRGSAGKKAAPVTYRFSLQVGAFGNEKNAFSFAEKMKKKGYDSFVEKDAEKPLYRVMIGKFPAAKEASEHAKKLREDGLKTIVRQGKG